MYVAYIQLHFRVDFIMEANTMNPDQTAPWEQSDLGPYCLQYRLPKNISRCESRRQVMTGREKGWFFLLKVICCDVLHWQVPIFQMHNFLCCYFGYQICSYSSSKCMDSSKILFWLQSTSKIYVSSVCVLSPTSAAFHKIVLQNPITVGNFAFLLNCTLMGRTSDSMVVPT